jgi:hypothetical protein
LLKPLRGHVVKSSRIAAARPRRSPKPDSDAAFATMAVAETGGAQVNGKKPEGDRPSCISVFARKPGETSFAGASLAPDRCEGVAPRLG